LEVASFQAGSSAQHLPRSVRYWANITTISRFHIDEHRTRVAVKEREIYQSANGDRWPLCRDDDRLFVLHRANEPSGGKFTPMELGDFLRKGNAGPEHQALHHMFGRLLDE
jgi:hypothetical protein